MISKEGKAEIAEGLGEKVKEVYTFVWQWIQENGLKNTLCIYYQGTSNASECLHSTISRVMNKNVRKCGDWGVQCQVKLATLRFALGTCHHHDTTDAVMSTMCMALTGKVRDRFGAVDREAERGRKRVLSQMYRLRGTCGRRKTSTKSTLPEHSTNRQAKVSTSCPTPHQHELDVLLYKIAVVCLKLGLPVANEMQVEDKRKRTPDEGGVANPARRKKRFTAPTKAQQKAADEKQAARDVAEKWSTTQRRNVEKRLQTLYSDLEK